MRAVWSGPGPRSFFTRLSKRMIIFSCHAEMRGLRVLSRTPSILPQHQRRMAQMANAAHRCLAWLIGWRKARRHRAGRAPSSLTSTSKSCVADAILFSLFSPCTCAQTCSLTAIRSLRKNKLRFRLSQDQRIRGSGKQKNVWRLLAISHRRHRVRQ